MARVVCQVVAAADRLTLLWSEGPASFPPYTLHGSALAELRRLTAEAHHRLAELAAGAGDAGHAGHQLAQVGHALYRSIFQLDQPAGGPGHEVRDWLAGTAPERLEIVGDVFT